MFESPFNDLTNIIMNLVIQCIDDPKIQNKIRQTVRVEMDSSRTKTINGEPQSYDSITSGNVNMQAKMAASGYDVYGRTLIQGSKNVDNNNIYKKMKNRIRYGRQNQNGYDNRGNYKKA